MFFEEGKQDEQSEEDDMYNFGGDEYENLDETQSQDPIKLRVKRATILCNKLIRENSELFRLEQKCYEMLSEMDEAGLYYNELDYKIKEMAKLIQIIQNNPSQLEKIKKTAMVENIH